MSNLRMLRLDPVTRLRNLQIIAELPRLQFLWLENAKNVMSWDWLLQAQSLETLWIDKAGTIEFSDAEREAFERMDSRAFRTKINRRPDLA